MTRFAESEVAALTWLESLGWQIKPGPEIALETLAAEHVVFDMASSSHRETWLAKLNARPFGTHKGWNPTGLSRRAPAAPSTSGG